jgi:hypothetical protein
MVLPFFGLVEGYLKNSNSSVNFQRARIIDGNILIDSLLERKS